MLCLLCEKREPVLRALLLMVLLTVLGLEHAFGNLSHRSCRDDHHGNRDGYNHEDDREQEDTEDYGGGVHFKSFRSWFHYKPCYFYERQNYKTVFGGLTAFEIRVLALGLLGLAGVIHLNDLAGNDEHRGESCVNTC
jgi:hypothetical protein